MRRGAARRTILSLCGLGLLAGAFALSPAGRADDDPLVRLASDALEVTIVHRTFDTLAPGQSLSFEETWEVRGYSGAADPEAHVRFLEGHRGGTR